MAKKITKELMDSLISEEIENLSEEEMNELFAGTRRRYGAWKAGRARKKQVKQWEAFKGNLSAKLDQLAGLYSEAYNDIMTDVGKNAALSAFAKDFAPWKNSVGGIDTHIQKLKQAATAVAQSPVEVSPDEGEAGAEEGEPEADPNAPPEVTRRGEGDPGVPSPEGPIDTSDLEQTDEEGNLVQQEALRRFIKKAQKLLKENKKTKVVK